MKIKKTCCCKKLFDINFVKDRSVRLKIFLTFVKRKPGLHIYKYERILILSKFTKFNKYTIDRLRA